RTASPARSAPGRDSTGRQPRENCGGEACWAPLPRQGAPPGATPAAPARWLWMRIQGASALQRPPNERDMGSFPRRDRFRWANSPFMEVFIERRRENMEEGERKMKDGKAAGAGS